MLWFRTLSHCSRLQLRLNFRAAADKNHDLYEILGVSRNCDQKQLKKAYYKLAQQYHPDKNSDENSKHKFAEINNAYEVLSDTNKRQIYDQTGNVHNNAGNQGASGFNPEDIFNQFRSQNMGSGGFQDILNDLFGNGGKTQNSRSRQPQSSVMSLTIDFEQSVKGTTKCVCDSCKGSRCKSGTQPDKCQVCNGSGVQTSKQGMYIMQTTCNSCQGQGVRIRQFCASCDGRGIASKTMKQSITIPRGIKDGANIRLGGKGNYNGDLIITVSVRKHPKYIRQGNNVHSQLQVPVLDAILGTNVTITNIYGQKKTVPIKTGIQPGDKITLQRQGFYVANSTQKGDHVITVKIVLPKTLSSSQLKLYQQLHGLK